MDAVRIGSQFEKMELKFQSVEELQEAFEKRMNELTSDGMTNTISYRDYDTGVKAVREAFFSYLKQLAA